MLFSSFTVNNRTGFNGMSTNTAKVIPATNQKQRFIIDKINEYSK